jgi:hypothetical protein
VAQDLGDKIEILKVDTEVEQDLASQLQIQVGVLLRTTELSELCSAGRLEIDSIHQSVLLQGLPTMILVGMDPNKPALRTEGMLPANQIKDLIIEEFMQPPAPPPSEGATKEASG